MGKQMATQDFINKAKLVHGNNYSYDETKYEKANLKVKIKCNKCGKNFLQTAYSHLRGRRCPYCYGTFKKTTEQFIEEARKIHGNKYDYSLVEYKNAHEKVLIKCQIHGYFYQQPNAHLSGKGCSKCASLGNLTHDEFIKLAIKVHGNKYDYSKTEFINASTKVQIKCPIHGIFLQDPYSHVHGSGCSHCAKNVRLTTEDFIKKAREIHGNKYDYSKVEYKNNHTKVCIICHEKDANGQEHGMFWQLPQDHLHGHGCSRCYKSILEDSIEILFTENKINYIIWYHTAWLERLSLDFYLPQYKIAIECQGKQHFSEKYQFGSSDSNFKFKLIQERDKRKLQLCKEHGIKLLYYTNVKDYDNFLGEPLYKDTDSLIKEINKIIKEQTNKT